MDIKIDHVDDMVVIKPIGELTNNTALIFKKERENLIKAGTSKFILDMGEVKLLSSIGIREILSLFKESEAKGGGVRLFNLRPQVKDILKTTGLLQVFKLYTSMDEAKKSF